MIIIIYKGFQYKLFKLKLKLDFTVALKFFDTKFKLTLYKRILKLI